MKADRRQYTEWFKNFIAKLMDRRRREVISSCPRLRKSCSADEAVI